MNIEIISCNQEPTLYNLLKPSKRGKKGTAILLKESSIQTVLNPVFCKFVFATPGLRSHEIASLSKKYGKKIFESYLENHTPRASRMFWTYGPEQSDITILALEPHPDPGAYVRVKLDQEP